MELVRRAFEVSNAVVDAAGPRSEPASAVDLLKLVRVANRASDEASAAYRELEPLNQAVKCKKGCSFCCYMRVHVTAPEVWQIYSQIIETFTPSEISQLVVRLEAAVSSGRQLTDEEVGNLRLACPLLIDGACSVYASRPLECRAYVSTCVDACEQALKDYSAWDVPIDSARYTLHKSAQAGILSFLVREQLEPELLELNRALLVALQEPEAMAKWLDGEKIFENARLPIDDPEFGALQPWTPTFQNWMPDDI